MNKRNYGIDLLRNLSMYMVVLLHVLGKGGILYGTETGSTKYHAVWILEIAAFCAVNCFALISGYVGVTGRFKFANLITLWLQVAFYTVGFTLIFAILKPGSVGLFEGLRAVLPVTLGAYWYFSAYFGAFLFSPMINAFLNTASRRQASWVVFTLCALSTVLPTFFNADPFSMKDGSSAIWLIVMYLLGGYIRKYGLLRRWSSPMLLLGYVVCVGLTHVAKMGWDFMNARFFHIDFTPGGLAVYDSPTILLCALFLLLLFERAQNLPGWLKKTTGFFAPLSFSVYIIHCQPLVWHWFMEKRYQALLQLPAPLLILAAIGAALGLYVFCSLLDLPRHHLFRVLKLKERLTRLEEKWFTREKTETQPETP